jgi:hypothetical protein
VIVDKQGVVRYSESVTPAGERNVDDLVSTCVEINGGTSDASAAAGVGTGAQLFVKSNCGHSRSALLAVRNLGLGDTIATRNVDEDATARADLLAAGGKDQAPCLILDGQATYEASAIINSLAERCAPLL